jgi:TonB family protein
MWHEPFRRRFQVICFMFLQYYRLNEQPFGVTPDPRYFYPSVAHREALASLIYSFESGLGFASLIAEPGLGKTMLLRCLMQQFGPAARTAFIFETQCDSREFLRHILCDLEANPSDTDMNAMFRLFRDLLIEESHAGRRVLLVVDEAQNLSPTVLETVRLLSNFETSSTKLVHIVLSGQPHLAQILARPELAQLPQRIMTIARLRPFSQAETAEYIGHRLQVGGYIGPRLFTPEAERLIAELSRGIPREINRVCFNALSLGVATKRKPVDESLLREIAADLGLRPVLAENPHTTAPAPHSLEPAPGLSKAPETAPHPSSARPAGSISTPFRGPNEKLSAVQCRPEAPKRESHAADSRSITNGSTAGAQTSPATSSVRRTAALANAIATAHIENSLAAKPAAVPARLSAKHPIAKVAVLLVLAGTLTFPIYRARFGTPPPHLAAPPPLAALIPARQQQSTSHPLTLIQEIEQSPARDNNIRPSQHANPPHAAVTATDEPNRAVPTADPASSTPVFKLAPDRNHRAYAQPQRADVLPEPPVITMAGGHGLPSLPELAVSVPVIAPSSVPRTGGEAHSISPAQLITRVLPNYPEIAKAAGIQGAVVLSAHINKDGKVNVLLPIKGNPLLIQAAMDAVRRWIYTPYMINGKPVESDTIVTVNFSR